MNQVVLITSSEQSGPTGAGAEAAQQRRGVGQEAGTVRVCRRTSGVAGEARALAAPAAARRGSGSGGA
jgi:hypothetical protein